MTGTPQDQPEYPTPAGKAYAAEVLGAQDRAVADYYARQAKAKAAVSKREHDEAKAENARLRAENAELRAALDDPKHDRSSLFSRIITGEW